MEQQTLKDYSWDLGDYAFRASMAEHRKLTMYDAENVYKLVPALPKRKHESNPNDYILKAKETHELKYLFFYLDENEAYFNNQIRAFLTSKSKYIAPERFMDLKLECREEVLRRFPDYDPNRGTTFITFIHRFIIDTMLRFRMSEEFYSFDSLSEYKDARRIMQLYTECYGDSEKTIRLFSEQSGCSEKTAAEKLKAAWRQRNRLLPRKINDEGEDWEQDDELIPDYWDYASILWDGMEAEKVNQAFWGKSMSYRDQTLLEQRNAICMTCGRVSSMSKRMSFDELATLFEGCGPSGAERAYNRAVEKLLLELVRLGQLHCVRIRQESVQRIGKKITAAVYAYQVDNDGEWGSIQFDLQEKTAWVETFAEHDLRDTWTVTDAAIQAVLESDNGKLPKKMLIPVDLERY